MFIYENLHHWYEVFFDINSNTELQNNSKYSTARSKN